MQNLSNTICSYSDEDIEKETKMALIQKVDEIKNTSNPQTASMLACNIFDFLSKLNVNITNKDEMIKKINGMLDVFNEPVEYIS